MDWDFFLFSRGGDSESGEDEPDETEAGVVSSEGEVDACDLGRSDGGGEDAAAGSTGPGLVRMARVGLSLWRLNKGFVSGWLCTVGYSSWHTVPGVMAGSGGE